MTTTSDPVPVSLLGRRVVRRIARGGFAAVYEVEDPEHGRLAVKQLHPEQRAVASVAAGFEREAAFLVAQRLPGVVRGIDFDGAAAALAMEYLDGVTLDRLIHSSLAAMPTTTRLMIGVSLCATLAAIHDLGQLHLDLKPDNVMLCHDGRVVLTDFGVGATVALTDGAGPVMGMIDYMAPEVLLHSGAADPRTDLYALGVLLYELLRGVRPYAIAKGTEIRAALEQVTPLDEAVGLTVPPLVAIVVQRAMAFTPATRWRSTREMGSLLAREVGECSAATVQAAVAAALAAAAAG